MATKTPAEAALKAAASTTFRKLVAVPPIEKLITSTPSATAWSIAAALSLVKQPPVFGLPSSQRTL